jgi:FkbM family methyltransferase
MENPIKYYSQIGQDKYYIENIVNHKRNGYFIDIGANNGINLSNTYVLEKNYNWKGLCVEVDDNLFEELKKNRRCNVVNECVYSISGEVKTLQVPLVNEIPEGNSMLIRIKDNPVSNNAFINQFQEYRTYNKISKTLNDIFKENNVPETIDYMSIDIEGAEIHIRRCRIGRPVRQRWSCCSRISCCSRWSCCSCW